MSITKIAIDLLHDLEKIETQKNDLLEALEGLIVLEPELWNDIRVKESFEKVKAAKESFDKAIAKAKGE